MTIERIDPRTKITAPANPFPGLRPFERSESYLFFGRDGQSEQMIAKLDATRFLAVVGASGSGKSSLVFAGLLPDLHGGLMAEAGSAWRVAVMRPRNDPIGNLARALNAPDVFGSDVEENRALQIAITEATLRRGSQGLIDSVRDFHLPSPENLLVVADQFEELFRVPRETGHDEMENDKAAFVKLLLNARVRRPEGPNIYVVMTMRSDYLGDCAQFWDLPEAINESQYLIPRLTREQRREAITGPVAVGNAEITPRLVNRLLNDVGDNPDQLPILQHALMRTWDEWKRERETGRQGDRAAGRSEDDENPQSFPIDLRHYEAIGGMAKSLSIHADEAFNELSPRRKQIAEKMFKCLTEKGADNREGRRPATIDKIRAVAEADEREVIAVIETFRKPGRSFLVSSTGEELNAKSLIDISHESLIRNWQGSEEKDETKRLKEWVDDEARSARIYRRLAETAVLHKRSEAALWGDPDLQLALNWRERQKPNRAWAQRYHPDFDLAERFLDDSRAAREAEFLAEKNRQTRDLRRSRIFVSVLSIALLLSLIALFYASRQKNAADDQKKNNRRLYYNASINLAKDAFARGDMAGGRSALLDFLDDPDGLRGFEWYHFWQRYPGELATIKGQGGPILSVAFSPDGQRLASGDDSGTVKLWEMGNAKGPMTIKAHETGVLSIAFSLDGKRLATGGADGTAKLWDAGSGQEISRLAGHGDRVRAAAFSPNVKNLASGSVDGTIKLWEMTTGKEVAALAGHTVAVSSVAISSNGKWLASGSKDGTVKLWDLSDGREAAKLDVNGQPVLSVTLSPDGKWLAIASEDGMLRLCETGAELKVAMTRKFAAPVLSAAFSMDGQRLSGGIVDGTIKLWETSGGQELATLRGHTDQVRSIVFSPDGTRLASGSNDATVKLWETSALGLATRKEHELPVKSIAYSPDGRKLASASEDGTIKLWDIHGTQEVRTIGEKGASFLAVAFSFDGKRLATGNADGTVQLWNAESGQSLMSRHWHGHNVSAVAFSFDGKWLASAGEDGKVMLWDAVGGQEPATLKEAGMSVWSIAFSPDGKRLAAGGADGTVNLWEIHSLQELPPLKAHADQVRVVAFSRDGRLLASGSEDGTAKLWDASGGQLMATLSGHGTPVLSVAFSPDGKRLASGGNDGMIKLWDTNSGREVIALKGQSKAVLSLAFSPDGNSLASGGEDATVRFWFAATGKEASRHSNR